MFCFGFPCWKNRWNSLNPFGIVENHELERKEQEAGGHGCTNKKRVAGLLLTNLVCLCQYVSFLCPCILLTSLFWVIKAVSSHVFAYKFSKIFTMIKVNCITPDREKHVFEYSVYRVVYGILSSFLGIRIEGEDGTSSWKATSVSTWLRPIPTY